MAFENIRLLLKDFEYAVYITDFFKEEFKVKNLNEEVCFLIQTDEIFKFYRKYKYYTIDAIGISCESNVPCRAHAALEYLNFLTEEIINYVENDKIYYKAFYFRKTCKNDVAFAGWTGEPVQKKCLKHLSYSQRLAYLN